MKAFIELMRPANCLMMGLAVIIGAFIAGKGLVTSDSLPRLILGFSTGFTLPAASMAINDYFDREIDSINQPRRPIPSGRIKPNDALVFAGALTIIGFAAAVVLSISTALVATLAWTMFTLYTVGGKKTGFPGNLLVSATVAIPFIYGAYATTNTLSPLIIAFASMAFLVNTGREVTKGIADTEGDRTKGIRTVAISLGERIAAYISAALYVAGAALSLLPILLGIVSLYYIPVVAIADGGFLYTAVSLTKNYSKENARRTKTWVLLWMLLGLVSFVIAGVGVQ